MSSDPIIVKKDWDTISQVSALKRLKSTNFEQLEISASILAGDFNPE